MTSAVTEFTQPSSALTPRRLKIALLGYRSHPHVGGQGIYLRYLSRALHALGHEVHVYSGPPYPELDDDIPLIKVPSLDLYNSPDHLRALRWRHLRSFTDTFEWWSMATGGFAEPYTFGRRAEKLLRNSDYDIIHDNQSLCWSLLTLQNRGHVVVSTVHHPIHRDRELAVNEAESWGMRLLVKRWHSFIRMQERVAQRLNYIHTVSSCSQADITRFFGRTAARTPVIFNGVDTAFFCPDSTVAEDALTLLSTSSSDHPLKGLRHVLEACAALRAEFPSLKLHIIGRLQRDGHSMRLIRKLGLEDLVQCHTGLSHDALVERYRRSSIVVCPSLYEGFGLPAAEAMACGRAVISSDGGALPEVVGDAGVVVPKADSHALAEAIRDLWHDTDRRHTLGALARSRAEHHFSWSRVARDLSTYYHQCIAER